MSIQLNRSREVGVRSPRIRSGLILLVCVGCALAGCGDGSSAGKAAIKQGNATNAQRLANLYQLHQKAHKGIGPNDEAEFRTSISKTNPVFLERFGVDPNSLDALFISERDDQAFIIRYGVKLKRDGMNVIPQAIVFEQEGEGGKRIVAFTGQKVEEVEETEYQELLGK